MTRQKRWGLASSGSGWVCSLKRFLLLLSSTQFFLVHSSLTPVRSPDERCARRRRRHVGRNERPALGVPNRAWAYFPRYKDAAPCEREHAYHEPTPDPPAPFLPGARFVLGAQPSASRSVCESRHRARARAGRRRWCARRETPRRIARGACMLRRWVIPLRGAAHSLTFLLVLPTIHRSPSSFPISYYWAKAR